MSPFLAEFLTGTWQVLLALAPWLLLGTVIAGVLHVALPTNFVRRHLSGRGSVAKAVLLGVPLPLCSCGVIPTGLGLKRDGASDGAAVGFLISTPQTGVDSILVSASFLGWPFALYRVAAAAITGLVGGWLTDTAGHGVAPLDPPLASGTVARRRGLRELLRHGLEILGTIWLWIVVGVVVSALIEALVPPGSFATLERHGAWLPALAALVFSLPLYVCATASVPIAAALVSAGLPAGAALVFLMAGPATNIATLGAIYRGLGRRPAAIYLGTIVVGSLLLGVLFDSVIDPGRIAPLHAHDSFGVVAVTSAWLLLAVLVGFAIRDSRRLAARLLPRHETAIEIGVTGMTCGGCATRLERALRGIRGVSAVTVRLRPGRAVVHGRVDEAHLRHAIEQAGFGVGSS